MARAYGLPAGAKKISAAGGYIPNFARYVYDADRIQPDKNALLKAILASGAKKNLLVGPAGSGKSTYGASLGAFITNVGQLAGATEIDILSGAARTKDGGISKNFQQIADAVNASGGKISYLYAGNMDILSRRMGRVGAGPSEGDLRSQKQIAGSMYAPLNQFDFISKVKGAAQNFEMIRGAKGYVPNFADKYTIKEGVQSIIGGIRFPEQWTSSGGSNRPRDQARAALAEINTQRLALGQKELSFNDLYSSEALQSKKDIIKGANQYAEARGVAMLLPTVAEGSIANDKGQLGVVPSLKNQKIAPYVKFKAFGLTTASATKQKDIPNIEARISDAIINEAFNTVNEFDPVTGKQPFDKVGFKKYFLSKGGAAGAVGAAAGATFEAAVDYAFNPAEAESGIKGGTTFDVNKISPTLRQVFGNIPSDISRGDYKISSGQTQKFADQILLNGLYDLKSAASGFIPNFAAGSPLGDAINREMAAGVSPSKIRITKDGRLRNSGNPNGLAVINTRDEPNGKIPNFVDEAKMRKNILGRGDVQGPMLPPGQNPIPMNAAQAAEALGKVQDSSKKLSIGMDKMLIAMSATMMATSTLEATFGKTNSAFGKAAIEVGKAASSMTQFASLGALIPGAGPFGAIAGAAIGLGMYGYQAATEPSRIAAEQRANVRQQELNPQGDLTEQINRIKSSIAKTKSTIKKAERDIEKSAPTTMTDESGQQLSIFKDEYNKNLFGASSEALKEEKDQLKLLEEALDTLERNQQDARDRRARDEAKAKKELEDRVALSEQIGQLNISYAKGEAAALTARTARYAVLTENASSLTEVEKRRAENALKIADVEERINNIGKETLYNLVKEVADKSKLATISKDQIEDLRKRFQLNENSVDLESEALKLGIEGAANLKALLLRASEGAKVAEIKLNAEKDALKIQLDAVDAGSLQATQIKNRLSLLDAEFNINEQIAESQRRNRIEQEQFDRASGLRSLKKQIAAKPFATPQEQARLAILEEDIKYTEDRKKIENDLNESRKKNFIDFQKQLISQIQNNEGIGKSIKPQIIANLQNADSIEKISEALSNLKGKTEEDRNSIQLTNDSLALQIELLRQRNDEAEGKKTRALGELQDPRETAKRTRDLLAGTVRGGMYDAFDDIGKEASSFSESFGKNTTLAFRDGMRDALSAAISQTDDLGAALQNVAMGFLKTMQSQFLNQAAGNITMAIGTKMFAKGGLVSGGSGYRDDVPAMLTGGEFVMRKSAVQKYGAANLAKMNSGGIFLPGVRGGGNITGYDQLRAFANQTTTSGATDVLRGGGSSAFINLEDQSSRLSRYALLGDDAINQEIRSAQEQGLNIITEREKYRTQQRKAFQQQLVGTIASAALMAGVSKMMTPIKSQVVAGQTMMTPYRVKGAYGGMIRRYAAGGPTDDIPALLMSGEYVMNRGATSKYGRRLLDSMNQGRAPRFADGGEVGSVTTTTESNAKMMGDVSININVTGQNSQTETQGNTNQGGIDYKKMSERIRAVVLETINEEKRLGGALRTR
jgi:hypothetical protein